MRKVLILAAMWCLYAGVDDLSVVWAEDDGQYLAASQQIQSLDIVSPGKSLAIKKSKKKKNRKKTRKYKAQIQEQEVYTGNPELNISEDSSSFKQKKRRKARRKNNSEKVSDDTDKQQILDEGYASSGDKKKRSRQSKKNRRNGNEATMIDVGQQQFAAGNYPEQVSKKSMKKKSRKTKKNQRKNRKDGGLQQSREIVTPIEQPQRDNSWMDEVALTNHGMDQADLVAINEPVIDTTMKASSVKVEKAENFGENLMAQKITIPAQDKIETKVEISQAPKLLAENMEIPVVSTVDAQVDVPKSQELLAKSIEVPVIPEVESPKVQKDLVLSIKAPKHIAMTKIDFRKELEHYRKIYGAIGFEKDNKKV